VGLAPANFGCGGWILRISAFLSRQDFWVPAGLDWTKRGKLEKLQGPAMADGLDPWPKSQDFGSCLATLASRLMAAGFRRDTIKAEQKRSLEQASWARTISTFKAWRDTFT
jgi:hypothetical protein